MQSEPQPGEVWVITDAKYGSESWQRIHDYGPFIVTYVTTGFIGFVAAGSGTDPTIHTYQRGQWNWQEHASRLWPLVPTWDELQEQGQCPDDLRAKALASAA